MGAVHVDRAVLVTDGTNILIPSADGGMGLSTITAASIRATVTRTSITCTNANTDYAAAAVIPAGTKYMRITCASDCIVTVDQVTDATHGIYVPAGTVEERPVVFGVGAGDSKVHAQSPTAGAVPQISYFPA